MAIRYGRGKFNAHENYIAYMNMVANSPIYSDMPNLRSPDGRINWQVSSGKTTSFFEYYVARFEWWVNVADKLGLPGVGNSNDRFSIAARTIHPTKLRACRLCGKDIYIGYMYLNANLAKRWNKICGQDLFEKQQQVDEAARLIEKEIGPAKTKQELEDLFPEKRDYATYLVAGDYYNYFFMSQHIRSNNLSPGYMANPPDRLDGFHDYCLHCRKSNDPGRSDENMRTYNHDRRAFMWWAEGDWKVADAIYNSAGSGICSNCGKFVEKVSPDHVGPLACGFKQNGFFEPLCGRCNSSKNRRFTFDNVISLLDYEERSGDSAASWQVRTLWDKVKEKVNDDGNVKTLSNYMRAMQDYYLRLLGIMARQGYYDFLTSLLHPEYAYYDITFEGLNPSTFEYSQHKKTKTMSLGARSLAARSVRIAFEELLEYCSKPPEKRKINKVFSTFLKEDIPSIESLFSRIELSDTDLLLKEILVSDQMSLDEKDTSIRKIIETKEFAKRTTRHQHILEKFQLVVSTRGRILGEMCISDIR